MEFAVAVSILPPVQASWQMTAPTQARIRSISTLTLTRSRLYTLMACSTGHDTIPAAPASPPQTLSKRNRRAEVTVPVSVPIDWQWHRVLALKPRLEVAPCRIPIRSSRRVSSQSMPGATISRNLALRPLPLATIATIFQDLAIRISPRIASQSHNRARVSRRLHDRPRRRRHEVVLRLPVALRQSLAVLCKGNTRLHKGTPSRPQAI